MEETLKYEWKSQRGTRREKRWVWSIERKAHTCIRVLMKGHFLQLFIVVVFIHIGFDKILLPSINNDVWGRSGSFITVFNR